MNRLELEFDYDGQADLNRYRLHSRYGSTFITLCDRQIVDSVDHYNSPDIWIQNRNELHTTLSDLSRFWAFHRNTVGTRN